MPDGTIIQNVPDGMTQADLAARYQAHIGASQPAVAASGPPSTMDQLRTNPVIGAPLQTLLRGGQGLEQLAVHSVADLADLGGHFPNPVANALRSVSDRVDTAIAGQNKGYEDSKARVVNSSSNPRVTNALINTGEIEGNMLNPAGLAGNAIKAESTVVNAGVRGAASGAGFAASQPVNDTANYWTEKAKQVATGTITGAVTGAAAEKLGQVKPNSPPSSSLFKGLASDAYDASKAAGVTIRKSSLEEAINNAETTAKSELTYRPGTEPKVATALETIRSDLAAAGDNIGFEEIDVARKIARKVLASPDKNERAVAHHIIDSLDDYVAGLKPGDVVGAVSGDPALIKAFGLKSGDNMDVATAALTEARGLFARGAKLETIERLVTKARDQGGAGQTQTKFDNALRQQFKQLKNNARAFRQFSPEEQAAITKIIRGTTPQNWARQIGKVAPTGTIPILSELSALGTAAATGHDAMALGVIGSGAAGLVGQHVANKIGAENVNGLRILVARGPQRLATPAPRPSPNALVRNPLATFAAQSLLQPRSQ